MRNTIFSISNTISVKTNTNTNRKVYKKAIKRSLIKPDFGTLLMELRHRMIARIPLDADQSKVIAVIEIREPGVFAKSSLIIFVLSI